MRIMIAGTGSGCGKTTATVAVLTALKKRGKNVVSFKCGPDYIDPTFHRRATEVDCFNLDPYLMGDDGVAESLAVHAPDRGIAVMEGVMGFYDGIGQGTEASSWHLSEITRTPVLLVVNTKGKSLSLCAEIQGFRRFADNRIAGVLLNRTKPAMLPFYKEMIEKKTGLKVVGYLPDLPQVNLESRRLGLVPADEIADIRDKILRLAETAMETFDFHLLDEIARKAPSLPPWKRPRETNEPARNARIYVARDEAFCFHYADNHRILRDFGATIGFFSPLRDRSIPDDADGLIFWGGYPELHASNLAANETLKRSIRKRHRRGMPIFAECGGFMYMQKRLADPDGTEHEMLGILDGDVSMTDRLQDFGYAELTARNDNMLCRKGDRIRAHAFHYSRCTRQGDDFTAVKAATGRSYPCMVATEKIFAGYPHLHFAGNRPFAARFLDACLKYRESK